MEKTNLHKKSANIKKDIKSKILKGLLPLGSKISTRIELEKEYSASSRTIQKSLTALIEEGFVVTKGRRGGSFVASNPPFKTNFALLFPEKYDYWVSRNPFFKALYDSIRCVENEFRIRIKTYHGYSNWHNIAQFLKLSDDLQNNKFAGVIFVTNPYVLEGTPLLADSAIIRAAIMSEDMYPEIPKVFPDRAVFINKTLDYLMTLGTKRPALLQIAQTNNREFEYYQAACENRGLNCETKLIHGISASHPQWSKNIVQAIMGLPVAERPDALIVADDALLNSVEMGLISVGITPDDNFPVVSLCNYPVADSHHLPIIKLGFAADKFLRLLVKLIIAQQEGRRVEPITLLPPMFAHENKEGI